MNNPGIFFPKTKSRWWFPNVSLREMIQFDLNMSEKTGLKLNYHLEKNIPPFPVQRNLSTPPTPPARQFDNMILTPDGHLKLLDFGTGDQEWRKTNLAGQVEELPPPARAGRICFFPSWVMEHMFFLLRTAETLAKLRWKSMKNPSIEFETYIHGEYLSTWFVQQVPWSSCKWRRIFRLDCKIKQTRHPDISIGKLMCDSLLP